MRGPKPPDQYESPKKYIHHHQRVIPEHFLAEKDFFSPFNDILTLEQVMKTLEIMKERGTVGSEFKQRFDAFERNIDGLLKRHLMIYKDGSKQNYYETLKNLDHRLIREQAKTGIINKKLEAANAYIQELEIQLTELREVIKRYQDRDQMNEIFTRFFEKVSQHVSKYDARKQKDFRSLIDQVGREVDKYNQFFNQVIQKVESSFNRGNRFRGAIMEFAKDINCRLSEGEFDQKAVQEAVYRFSKTFSNPKYKDQLERQVHMGTRLAEKEENIRNILSIMQNKISAIQLGDESIGRRVSDLQISFKNLKQTMTSRDRVELFQFQGWIDAASYDHVVHVPVADQFSKSTMIVMGTALKTLIDRYPKIKSEIDVTLLQILEMEFMKDAVQVDSWDRLKEIVKKEEFVVKVDNVFKYDNEKQRTQIFHLRVLIKALLEELMRIRDATGEAFTLDEGILAMIRGEIIDGVDVEHIYSLFRPQPKVVEVQKIVERIVPAVHTYENHTPITVTKTVPVDTRTEVAVPIITQVPIEIQCPLIIDKKEAVILKDKQIEVARMNNFEELVAERVLVSIDPVEKIVEKEILVNQIIIEPKQCIKEVPVMIEKQKVTELPVEIVKEVPINNQPLIQQKIVQKIVKVEVPKQIKVKQNVYLKEDNIIEVLLDRQVPVHVEIPKNIQKQVAVQVRTYHERPVEVPCVIQKAVIQEKIQTQLEFQQVDKIVQRQIPRQFKIQVADYVSAPREVEIKTVEIIKQVPFEVERLVTKENIRQKLEVVIVKQQVCVPIQLNTPCFNDVEKVLRERIIEQIPMYTEIVKEVPTEVSVPIVIQKPVIQAVPVVIEKACRETVEVPVVIEVQKIVQKIVVVPRICHVYHEFPVIIQKIVEVEKTVLQIVQVPVTHVECVKTQVPKQVETRVEVEVPVRKYETIVQEKLVIQTIEKEKIFEIERNNIINQQVKVEKPIPYYIERHTDRPVQVEKKVILTQQVSKPYADIKLIEQERPYIVAEKVFEPIEVPVIIEKVVPMYVEVEKIVQIQTERQVPMKVQVPKELLTEKLVVKEKEIPKECQIERIQYLMVSQQIPIAHYLKEQVFAGSVSEKLIIAKQGVPIQVPVVHYLKEQIPIEGAKHVPVEASTVQYVPTLKTDQFIQEVQKKMVSEVPIIGDSKTEVMKIESDRIVTVPGETRIVEVMKQVQVIKQIPKPVQIQGETKIVYEKTIQQRIKQVPRYEDRIFEKITLLPTVHQVTKTVHEVTEKESLGVAAGVSEEDHRIHSIDMVGTIRDGLGNLLAELQRSSLRGKNAELIKLMKEYIVNLEQWLKYPRIAQVVKEVPVERDHDRAVVVQVHDQKRESVFGKIIDSLLAQLLRIKTQYKIDVNLDDNLKWIFQYDIGRETLSENANFQNYFSLIEATFTNMEQWKHNNLSMLHSFLSNRFVYADMVNQLNSQLDKCHGELGQAISDNERYLKRISQLKEEKDYISNDYLQLLRMIATHQCQNKQEIDDILKDFEGKHQPGDGFDDQDDDQLHGDSVPGNSQYKFSRSRYTSARGSIGSGYNNLLTSRLESVRRMRGITLVNSEIYDPAVEQEKIKLLISRYSSIQKQKNDLQQRYEELSKSFLSTKMMGQQGEGSENFNAELDNIRNSYDNQIKHLENDRKRLRQEVDRLKSSAVQTSGAQGSVQNARRQVSQEFERRIRDMQNQHNYEMERMTKDYQRSTADSGSFERIKKQMNDDFERRIKRIEDNHQLELNRIRAEIESSAKRSQTSPISKMQDNQYQKQAQRLTEQVRRLNNEIERMKRSTAPHHQIAVYSTAEDPRQEKSIKGPAKFEGYSGRKKFETSPPMTSKPDSQRQYEKQEVVSSGSRDSGVHEGSKTWKATMTLKIFLENEPTEDLISLVMLKIIDALQEENNKGIMNCYTPNNIYIKNFSISNLNSMFIKFGAPILNKKNRKDGTYIAPEVHHGDKINAKSLVFSLGIIWDELLNKTSYFSSINEVQNPQYHYEVRDPSISPIIKNLLVDMLTKDPDDRIDLDAVRKRLSLQKHLSGK